MVCASLKKGTKAEKIVFTISMLFTVPFLYQYERGNIIFLALCFTMLFFLWKDSENRILRELSFFSLAGAAGLKIYPAVFGLLLVREKRYKEAVRLMIYGLISFFLPFLCFGSFLGNIKKMISNMKTVTAEFASVRVGCQLNYSATLKNLLGWMGNYSVAVLFNRSDSGICFGNPCGTWTEGEVEAGASSDHPDDGNPIFQLYVCRNFHGASGHRVSGRIGDT